jgi:hypothetical protein
MRSQRRGWTMPEEDMRSLLRLIDEKVRSSEIEVRHRDALIRLRSILESDLADLEEVLPQQQAAADRAAPSLAARLWRGALTFESTPDRP